MRTTVNIDDELLARAHAAAHVTAKIERIQEALKALVERESARRLAKSGGVKPGFGPFPAAVLPMILIDTSVWIEHLRQGDKTLARLLNNNQGLIHFSSSAPGRSRSIARLEN